LSAIATPVDFGINLGLPSVVVIDLNVEVGSGKPVATAAALQAVLDGNPHTAVHVKRSSFEIIPDGSSTGIAIRSNRSLVMDNSSVIYCDSHLPLPLHLPSAEAKYGPHLVLLTGTNVGFKGGTLLQQGNTSAGAADTVGVRIFMARDAKLVGVNLTGSWGNHIRIFNGDGATSPTFPSCPSYFNTACQIGQLPFADPESQLSLSAMLLRGLTAPPVSLLGNTITATAVGTRAIWLTWAFGAVVARNVIRGPLHYGVDLDAMASFSVLTANDVEVHPGSDRHAATALFVEMQCRSNVIASNRLVSLDSAPVPIPSAGGGAVMVAGGYGLNLNSFLNFAVSNDLGGSGLKISGTLPYPVALSNRLVGNTNVGRFNAQHAGCGNYATENVVAPSAVANGMELEDCAVRPGGCADTSLNRSFGCLDPAGGYAAMLLSDVAPPLPRCLELGGTWLATGHDSLALTVVQVGTSLKWYAAEYTTADGEADAEGAAGAVGTAPVAYNGTGTISGGAVDAILNASYPYHSGVKRNTYRLHAVLPAACDRIEWFRVQSSHVISFANWTRRQQLGAPAAPKAPGVPLGTGRGGGGGGNKEALVRKIAQKRKELASLEHELAALL
jgi:hypothetical protein